MNPSMIRRMRPYSTEIGFVLKVIAICLISSLCVVLPALAKEDAPANTTPETQITMSPTRTNLELKRGQVSDGSVTVFNSGWKDFDFKVYSAPYSVSNSAYDPVFTKDSNRTQISRWVKFDKTDFNLAAGKTVEIKYHVNVPSDIPDGGQYAVIFAETSGEKEANSSVVSKKRVGTLLYAKTDGQTRESGSVEMSGVNFWQTSDKTNLKASLKNSGNTDFDAKLEVNATPWLGSKSEKVADKTYAVLPETTRDANIEWKHPSFGIYKLSAVATVLGKETKGEWWVFVASPALILGFVVLLLAVAGGIAYAKTRKTKK